MGQTIASRVEGIARRLKIGFCFYDFTSDSSTMLLQEAVYSRQKLRRCSTSDSAVGMGLSWGWARPISPFVLPGQSVDVTNVPDGHYRLRVRGSTRITGFARRPARQQHEAWVDLDLDTDASR